MSEQHEGGDESLHALANIAEEAISPRSAQSIAVSDQMVHRHAALMADIYSHAMSRIVTCRQQLDQLEQSITAARERSNAEISKFMSLVNDGEEAIRSIESAMARVGDHAQALGRANELQFVK